MTSLATLPVLLVGVGASLARGQNTLSRGLQIELEQVYRSVFASTIDGVPTGLLPRPDGGYLFADSIGKVHVVQEGGTTPGALVLDISAETSPVNSGGRGLLSINYHPDYLDSTKPGYRKLYTYHVQPDDGPDDGTGADLNNGLGPHTQFDIITEWTVNSDFTGVVSNSRREVVRLGHPNANNHSGGSLVFDDDNYLYLSHGSTVIAHSQDLSNTLGTVIRIDPLDPTTNVTSDPISGNGSYRIPSSNPFVSTPGALDEVYAYGVRNPFRMSRDPETGVIFVGDVGQGAREEISQVIAGGNNGWPRFEGEALFGPGQSVTLNTAGPLVDPLVSYTRDVGRSVTGGAVYRGTAIPELVGKYVFGDLIRAPGGFFSRPGRLLYFDPYDENGDLITDSSQIELLEFQLGAENANFPNFGPTSFSFDEDGELLVAGNIGGRELVFRIAPTDPGLVGDYNGDGLVNTADYAVWRDSLGSPLGLTNRDPSVEGLVGDADYQAWRNNLGASAPLAVPEPSSALALGLAVLGYGLAGRRSSRA